MSRFASRRVSRLISPVLLLTLACADFPPTPPAVDSGAFSAAPPANAMTALFKAEV